MADWLTMFDGQLELAGRFSEEALGRVPAKRGVFALLAEGDRPVVLMTGADIRARIRNRLRQREPDERGRTADLRKITRKVLFKLAGGHFETDLQFLELARAIWPKRYRSLVAWKPAWFVHVDAGEQFPHFARTRDVLSAGGLALGPFACGRDAERFIGAIQDAFDLCRDVRRLRGGSGQGCAYAQMGRCPGACENGGALARYRRLVGRAAEFATGARGGLRAELKRLMASAAADLQYERAASIKARLERLAVFNSPAFRHVAPLDAFRFLMVQPGAVRSKARLFFVNRGDVAGGGELDWPPARRQLSGACRRMSSHRFSGGSDDARALRMGLVARYLFSSERRRGLILRWNDYVTPATLGKAIEAARVNLRLRAAAKRKSPAAGKAGGD